MSLEVNGFGRQGETTGAGDLVLEAEKESTSVPKLDKDVVEEGVMVR